MTTFDEDFDRAHAAAGEDQEDEHVYLDYPAYSVKTPRQWKHFKEMFREWARGVRESGWGDVLGPADRVAGKAQHAGKLHDFAALIDLMLTQPTRDHIRRGLKRGAFVRFHIRSPKGKKIVFVT